jgi:hypothetical protein
MGYPFSDSCEAHDRCYGLPGGPSRSSCDNKFRDSLNESSNLVRDRNKCKKLADFYANVVDKNGDNPYWAGKSCRR